MELKHKYEIGKHSHYKSKKYVFKIYPENINHIDNLGTRDRDEMVNQAIDAYFNQYKKGKKQHEIINQCKKFIIYTAVILLLLPIIGYFIKLAFDGTPTANKNMQYNFERLFDQYEIK